MSDIREKEAETIRTAMDSMVERALTFNAAIEESDIFLMTQSFIDLEYDHLILLSDIASDPLVKTEILQTALAVRSQLERSRFFPPYR